ncbi:MAG: class I SAM-dependent methyltransferase [Terriglobia bacterium]
MDRIVGMIDARGSRASIMRAYNLFSFLYGRTIARLEREAVTRGLARAQVRPGERVLEVGVGPAAVLMRLRESLGAQGELIGVDVAPRMLAATRRRLPDARLVQADARALPVPADYFDLLWASYLLDLIPTDELTPLLREFRRVLKPGGRVLLVNFSKEAAPTAGAGLTWWERAYRLAPAWLVPYLFGSCRPVQAAPFVRAAGFTAIERTFLPGGLDSEVVTARK